MQLPKGTGSHLGHLISDQGYRFSGRKVKQCKAYASFHKCKRSKAVPWFINAVFEWTVSRCF